MQPETLVVMIVGIAGLAAIRITLMLVVRRNAPEAAGDGPATAAEPDVPHLHAHRGTGRQRHLMILDDPLPAITAPSTRSRTT